MVFSVDQSAQHWTHKLHFLINYSLISNSSNLSAKTQFLFTQDASLADAVTVLAGSLSLSLSVGTLVSTFSTHLIVKDTS
jgi:hypothetical protein